MNEEAIQEKIEEMSQLIGCDPVEIDIGLFNEAQYAYEYDTLTAHDAAANVGQDIYNLPDLVAISIIYSYLNDG